MNGKIDKDNKLLYDIPFVPSAWDHLQTMIEMSGVEPGDFTADLGSGDGRVVIAMAGKGAIASGFEIDEERYLYSTRKIKSLGLGSNAFIYHVNFWDVDMSPYNIITLYGITSIMKRLEEKLIREIKPDCKVISNVFPFPNWPHVRRKNDIYVYQLI